MSNTPGIHIPQRHSEREKEQHCAGTTLLERATWRSQHTVGTGKGRKCIIYGRFLGSIVQSFGAREGEREGWSEGVGTNKLQPSPSQIQMGLCNVDLMNPCAVLRQCAHARLITIHEYSLGFCRYCACCDWLE